MKFQITPKHSKKYIQIELQNKSEFQCYNKFYDKKKKYRLANNALKNLTYHSEHILKY